MVRLYVLCVFLLSSGIAYAQGVPPEYCHTVVNWYHCGHVDERRPRPLPVFEEIQTPAPGIPIGPGWMYGWIDATGIHNGMPPYEVWMKQQRGAREGGDEELRALGSVVNVGEMMMGHICIAHQKYIYTMEMRDITTTMTFTCNADELTLSGPTIKHIRGGHMVPYMGGPTWVNVK
jgi:hypothetical protein